MDDKRRKMLEIVGAPLNARSCVDALIAAIPIQFFESRDFFHYKDIEKIAAKQKGISGSLADPFTPLADRDRT